ncbi:MAG TPA: HAMP domain-containing protein [Chromatiales bacterium]|nr:HAMP domain-containing protein [Chromatiales bacterium]
MGRLFWKFLIAFWLALLLAGAVVGTTVWLHQRAQEQAAASLATGPRDALLVRTAALTLRHGGLDALRSLLEEWRDERGVPVLAVDESGRELLGRPVSAEALASARELAQIEARPRVARLVPADDGSQVLLFVLAREGAVPHRHRHPQPPPLALLLLGGLLGSLAFSALLAWSFSRPIRNLRWALAQFEQGRLDTRVQPRMGRRRDEISDLGADFDRMAGQIEALVGAQKRLLHDVSHELRSPLARLQVAVGLARQQPDKLADYLERIERESQRLDRLVGEVLTLARLESGMVQGRREDIDLGDLLADVVEDARFEAEAKGRRIELVNATEGRDRLHGQPELLHRAIENVIRNALHHTPEGGAVEVSLHEAGRGLLLTVEDHGPGVPEAELATIFEPFRRGAHEQEGNGYGLGLAIARRAIEAHGGTIQAVNRPEGGLRVTIDLPAAGKE